MVAASAALALAACKKDARPPDKMDPVSIDEAKAMAAEFEKAIAPCDPARVGELLDGDNLIRRAVQASDLPAGLRRQLTSGGAGGSQIAGMLCQGMGADASYVLLRIREVNGQPQPIFRLISDDAVNYHELALGKSKKDHKVRAVDIRVYATGDFLSESMAQMFEQAAAAMKNGGDPMRLKRTTDALNRARQGGDPEEVRRLLAEMPAELRNTKPMRLAELMVGADLDEATYTEIMERYRRDFPNDPSADVVSVDYFFLKKDIGKTVEVLDKLDRQVGGDPYLGVLRANAYLLDEEPAHVAAAVDAARKATEAEPTLEAAWWALTAALLTKKDHAALPPVVDTLRTKFQADISPEAMAGNDLWTDYFASEAYKQSAPKLD